MWVCGLLDLWNLLTVSRFPGAAVHILPVLFLSFPLSEEALELTSSADGCSAVPS